MQNETLTTETVFPKVETIPDPKNNLIIAEMCFPKDQLMEMLNAACVTKEQVEEMIEERVDFVAPEERDAVMKKLKRRCDEWRVWQPSKYGGFGAAPQDPPLLHPAGITVPPQWNGRSWPTMSSLRNVDASCQAVVTGFFNQLPEDQL